LALHQKVLEPEPSLLRHPLTRQSVALCDALTFVDQTKCSKVAAIFSLLTIHPSPSIGQETCNLKQSCWYHTHQQILAASSTL
jgi:hypothetical protein